MSLDCESALNYKLANTAGVSTLVGSRIHPVKLPETVVLPAMTYQLISGPHETTHDESLGTLAHKRYQIDSWAATYAGVKALAAATKLALNGFKGTITSGADTFVYQSCLIVDERDNYEPDTALYWISQDYQIWHVE